MAPMLRLQGNCLGIARMKGATAAELCSLVHMLVLQQQEDVITEKRPSEPCPRGREAGRSCPGFNCILPAQVQTPLTCIRVKVFRQTVALP